MKKKHDPRPVARPIENQHKAALNQLLTAVRDVQARREMNASESPAMQDAWDRLKIAVLETELLLQKPVDKRRK